MIRRKDQRQRIGCDSCPAEQADSWAIGDFDVMKARAKADGWAFADTGKGWQHTCPNCRAAAGKQRRLF
jgi:hypothetical protein